LKLERQNAGIDPGQLEEIVDEQREHTDLLAQRGKIVGRLGEAVDLLDDLVLADEFAEFLTPRAYSLLDSGMSA